MKISQLLSEFYTKNGLPADGGSDDKFFYMNLFGRTIKLPNPEFRRKVTHIHDVQHVVHKCDTSWEGEAFITGWEIATEIWKHFPISLFSLWAMGYTLWSHPKAVFAGFQKGLSQKGIIDLDLTKDELLNLDPNELNQKLEKPSHHGKAFTISWFLLWSLVSQLVFLFPLLTIILFFWLI